MRYLPVLLLVIPFVAPAQKLKMAVDKKTKDTLWYTTMENLYSRASSSFTSGERLDFSITRNKDSVWQLQIKLLTPQLRTVYVNPGQTVEIHLTNGLAVPVAATQEYSSTDAGSSHGQQIVASYLLKPAQLIELLTTPAQTVRVQHSEGHLDYELPGHVSQAFIKALRAHGL